MKSSRQVTLVYEPHPAGVSVRIGRSAAPCRSDESRRVFLEEVLYISSPKALKKMSLGYDGLLADIYWTRAVQYFGGKHHEGAHHFNLLAPLLEITTTLDPHLLVAYEYRREASSWHRSRQTGQACPSVPFNLRNLAFATIPMNGVSTTTRDSSVTWN